MAMGDELDRSDRLKHLDYLQSAIGRMSSISSITRGWAITVAAGLSALAAADSRIAALTIAITSTVLFWGLDGYYLWLERGFIKIFQTVSQSAGPVTFSMQIDKAKGARTWLRTCMRPHLLVFYGSIVVIDGVGIVYLKGV